MYGVDSISFVIRTDDELLAERLHAIIKNTLRSLDLVTLVKHKYLHSIVLMFPFADKAAALGFLNRLLSMVDGLNERDFEYMTFDFSKTELFDRYISEDKYIGEDIHE